MRLASVILDIPTQALDAPYTYVVPEIEGAACAPVVLPTCEAGSAQPGDLAGELDIEVGCAVLVPFGHRQAVGFVVALRECGQPGGEAWPEGLDPGKLKAIVRAVSRPYFDEEGAACALWLSERYVAPLSACVRLFTPPGGVPRMVRAKAGYWRLEEPAVGEVDDRWVLPGPAFGDFEPRKNAVKLYDDVLATFEFVTNDFGEASARGLEIAPATKHLLPLNMVVESSDAELSRWLETRRIPKGRAYIERILAPFGLAPSDTKGIIDVTKGVSINDSYSIIAENDDGSFKDYNLFDNDFDEVLQFIAYTGHIPPDAIGSGIPSELSPSGSFPKTWRIENGKRVLYKAGSALRAANTGKEPYSEFFAWQVARAMGLFAIRYDVREWQGEICSTCELFNSKDVSFVPFGYALSQKQFAKMDLEHAFAWFNGDQSGNAAGAIPPKELGLLEDYKSMLVFDSIIANPDRHLGNYGVLRDNRTGRIIGMAPIFDNNMALFAHEFTSDLTDEFMEAKVRATTGAFSPSVTAQAKYAWGQRQRDEVSRLQGFEFEQTPFVSQWNASHEGSRSAFPPERLEALNRFVQRRATLLSEQ